MKKVFFSLCMLLFTGKMVCAQKAANYVETLKGYQKKYVDEHEVVKGKDRKYLKFFPIDSNYRVNCHFEKMNDTIGFTMKTSANTLKHYYKYGQLHFNLNGVHCHLSVYQSRDLMQNEQYKDYLFIPFTDQTTGDESYGSGRYIDLLTGDFATPNVVLDFNKAYNPYCAYTTGYKCPIPPKENTLPVAVKAGEMNYGKAH
ncbi:MAG: DUF1684 domain-containing protein [Chitinophagaceae bacterium]|nr:DUF1684 domain-containing protein [Chitinophagaceae bacterium]